MSLTLCRVLYSWRRPVDIVSCLNQSNMKSIASSLKLAWEYIKAPCKQYYGSENIIFESFGKGTKTSVKLDKGFDIFLKLYQGWDSSRWQKLWAVQYRFQNRSIQLFPAGVFECYLEIRCPYGVSWLRTTHYIYERTMLNICGTPRFPFQRVGSCWAILEGVWKQERLVRRLSLGWSHRLPWRRGRTNYAGIQYFEANL